MTSMSERNSRLGEEDIETDISSFASASGSLVSFVSAMLGEVVTHEVSFEDTNSHTGNKHVKNKKQKNILENESDEASDSDADVDESPERNFIISGRVLDLTGFGLPGISVNAKATRLFEASQEADIPSNEQNLSTVSGSDGSYAFDSLMNGEYRISTGTSDYYSSASVTVRAGVQFADLLLSAQRPLLVVGGVMGRDGQPIAGVRVRPLAKNSVGAQSDGDGRFAMMLNVMESTNLSVQFEREGYKTTRVPVRRERWEREAQIELHAVMEPAQALAKVTGSVGNSEGSPMAGKLVQLSSSQLGYEAITDQNGRFAMQDVAVGSGYELRVRPGEGYRDYRRQHLSVSDAGLRVTAVVEPEGTGNLIGQMVDSHGNTIAGVSLTLRSQHSNRNITRVTGDAGGNFVVPNVPAGTLVFESRSVPKFTISGVDMPPGGERFVPLTLDLGRHELHGRVLDGQDAPVAVSQVFLTSTQVVDGVKSLSNRSTAADATGYFRFTQLGPGPHTVIVNTPGFKSTRLTHDITTQGYDVVLRLKDKA